MESKESTSNTEASQKFAEIKPMTFDEVAAVIRSRDSKKLKEVIDEGRVSDINMKNENLQSLLMVACRIVLCATIECVRVLLDHNADIHYQTDSDSVLKCACLGRHGDVLSLIIERGVTLSDSIILHLFESENIVRSTEIATIFVQHIEDVNWEEGHLNFVLQAIRFENWTIFDLLIERGAYFRFVYPDPPKIIAREGETVTVGAREGITVIIGRHMTPESAPRAYLEGALRIASRGGHMDDVQRIVEHGITVDALICALCAAVQGNHLEIAEYLLNNGADYNSVARTCYHSAWIYACQRGSPDMVRMLLDRGADPNAVDDKEQSPLKAALSHPEVLRMLLEHGADPNRRGSNGFTVLLEVLQCRKVCMPALTLLLEYGADPNQDPANTGYTLLMLASFGHHINIMRVLLEHGADVTRVNEDGNTVVDMLWRSPEDDEMRELCTHYIDCNKPGATPVPTLK